VAPAEQVAVEHHLVSRAVTPILSPAPPKERRWSARRPTTLGLRLYAAGESILIGAARNISIGGLFVEAPSACLTADTQVFIVFDEGRIAPHPRIAARVIRLEARGAALLFGDFSFDTVQMLRALVRAALD
jgi:hypothetical protein